MDHEAICDCPFKDTCQTYADPMVQACEKGPAGRGCEGVSDEHRREHCKAFTCKYLTVVLASLMGGRSAGGSKAT